MTIVIFMDDSYHLIRQAEENVMRVSNEEKERSRDRIVAAASRLFREKGVEGASVGDIMREAGLTHGGFYRHFADKEALLTIAVSAAFDNFAAPMADAPEGEVEAAVRAFRAAYLSEEHRASPGQGCPAAALGPDIARVDDSVRTAFTSGMNRMIEGLARGLTVSATPRVDAIRDLSMMVGAIIISRAAEDRLASEVLDACSRAPKRSVVTAS